MNKEITISNNFSTVIPNGVYDSNFKKQMLSNISGYKKLKSPVVFEDQIHTNLINVWCVEKADITAIKNKHTPDAVIHQSSHFLKDVLGLKEKGIFICLHDDTIFVCVVKNNKLQLFNRLSYSAKEDILYFILLYQDQFNLQGDIYLTENFNSVTKDFINKYIGEVNLFKSSSFKKINVEAVSCGVSEICE